MLWRPSALYMFLCQCHKTSQCHQHWKSILSTQPLSHIALCRYFKKSSARLICRTCLASKFNIFNHVSPFETCETASTSIGLTFYSPWVRNVLGFQPHNAVHYTLYLVIIISWIHEISHFPNFSLASSHQVLQILRLHFLEQPHV